jgi:2-keto-3-deoxy-L-arabinonate dehydratase
MVQSLAGVLPIVHTPFDEHGEIDWPVLNNEVDWAFDQGIDGLGTGMVSEIARLSADERRDYAVRLVEFSRGRGPVFMAVTADEAANSLIYAKQAESAGCAAIMAAPPLVERNVNLGAFYC